MRSGGRLSSSERFCQAWDHAKFVEEGCLNSGEATAVTEAMSCSLFRQYIYMVYSVHKLLTNFESWLESCPCHEHLRHAEPSRKRKSAAQGRMPHEFSACPMRAKRSSELAAGAVDNLLSSLDRLSFQDLGADEVHLSEDDRSTLLQDFHYAKVFLRFGLSTKLQFWGRIPWKLCGLGHHFVSEARAAARDCLCQYDQAMQNELVSDGHHHALTVKFLGRQGPLRPAVEAFVAGEAMSADLLLAVAELKFIPCVERVVEGLHRDVKVASKHVQLGPTKVSMSVRLREIQQHCDSEAGLQSLLEHFENMRYLKRAASLLGVFEHPRILELAVHRVTDTGTWWKELQYIVHRCVLDEQFADYHEARALHDKKSKADKEVRDRLHARQALPVPRTFDTILKRFICERLRATVDSGSFLSMPVSRGEASYQLTPLDDCGMRLGPLMQLADGGAAEGPDVGDVEGLSESESTHPGLVVFRVLHGNPSRLKLVPSPLAAAPQFPPGSFAVAMHKVDHESSGNPAIDVSSQTNPMLLQGVEQLPLDVLRHEVFSWKMSPQVKYTLPCPGFEKEEISRHISTLVDAGAVPDEPYTDMPLSSTAFFAKLEQLGFAQTTHGSDSQPLVRLTQAGMTRLRFVSDLVSQEKLCVRSNCPLSESDTLDLLLDLEAAGWTWQALTPRIRQREALAYTVGAPKVFYSQSHMVNPLYLQCLLQADRIFEIGAVDRIPHWARKPSIVYSAILKGQVPPQPCPPQDALQLQDETHDDLAALPAPARVKRSGCSGRGRGRPRLVQDLAEDAGLEAGAGLPDEDSHDDLVSALEAQLEVEAPSSPKSVSDAGKSISSPGSILAELRDVDVLSDPAELSEVAECAAEPGRRMQCPHLACQMMRARKPPS